MALAKGGLTNDDAELTWTDPKASLGMASAAVLGVGLVALMLWLGVFTFALVLVAPALHFGLRAARNAMGLAPEWTAEWNLQRLVLTPPDRPPVTIPWRRAQAAVLRDGSVVLSHEKGRLTLPAPPELDDAQWLVGCWQDAISGSAIPPMLLASDGHHEALLLSGHLRTIDHGGDVRSIAVALMVSSVGFGAVWSTASALGSGAALLLGVGLVVLAAVWTQRQMQPRPVVMELFASHMTWQVPHREESYRIPWDSVSAIAGNGQSLFITDTDERTLTIDLSASPLALTWDLANELRRRQRLLGSGVEAGMPKTLEAARQKASVQGGEPKLPSTSAGVTE